MNRPKNERTKNLSKRTHFSSISFFDEIIKPSSFIFRCFVCSFWCLTYTTLMFSSPSSQNAPPSTITIHAFAMFFGFCFLHASPSVCLFEWMHAYRVYRSLVYLVSKTIASIRVYIGMCGVYFCVCWRLFQSHRIRSPYINA